MSRRVSLPVSASVILVCTVLLIASPVSGARFTVDFFNARVTGSGQSDHFKAIFPAGQQVPVLVLSWLVPSGGGANPAPTPSVSTPCVPSYRVDAIGQRHEIEMPPGCPLLQSRTMNNMIQITLPSSNSAADVMIEVPDSADTRTSMERLKQSGFLSTMDEQDVAPQEETRVDRATKALLDIEGVGSRFIATSHRYAAIRFVGDEGETIPESSADEWFRGMVSYPAIHSYLERTPGLLSVLAPEEDTNAIVKEFDDDSDTPAARETSPSADPSSDDDIPKPSVADLPEDLFTHLIVEFEAAEDVQRALNEIAPIDRPEEEGGFTCNTRQVIAPEAIESEFVSLDERIPEHRFHTPTLRALMRKDAMDMSEKGDRHFTARSKFNHLTIELQFVIHNVTADTPDTVWGQHEIDNVTLSLNQDFEPFGIRFHERKPFATVNTQQTWGVMRMEAGSDKEVKEGSVSGKLKKVNGGSLRNAYIAPFNDAQGYDTTKMIVVHILRTETTSKNRDGTCGAEGNFPYTSSDAIANFDNHGKVKPARFVKSAWGTGHYTTFWDEGCIISPWVFAHEIGHMFGLYHPWHTSTKRFTKRYRNNYMHEGQKSGCLKGDVDPNDKPDELDYWNIMNYRECGTKTSVTLSGGAGVTYTYDNSRNDIDNVWSVNVVKKFTPGQAERTRKVIQFVNSKHAGAYGIGDVKAEAHKKGALTLSKYIVDTKNGFEGLSPDTDIATTLSNSGKFNTALGGVIDRAHDLSDLEKTASDDLLDMEKDDFFLGKKLHELDYFSRTTTKKRNHVKARKLYNEIIDVAKRIVKAAEDAKDGAM